MTLRVILSSDQHPHYAFYAPLTAAVWKTFGWKPTVLLVGSKPDWAGPGAELVTETLKAVTDDVHYTGRYDDAPSTATVAQVCRLFATALPGIRDSDYLLTSDVDMWPGPSQWIGHYKSPGVHLYNGLAYAGQAEPQYPMCYIGMEAGLWRHVVCRGEEFDLVALIDRALKELAILRERTWKPEEVKERTWDFDERCLGRLIHRHQNDGGTVAPIRRTMDAPGERRLDRSSWRLPLSGGQVDLTGYADVHLPRPGYGPGWRLITPVLEALLPRSLHEWAHRYHEQWCKAAPTSRDRDTSTKGDST